MIHYLADYQPPDYTVETVDLNFNLLENHTEVTAKMRIRANYIGENTRPLILNGEHLELLSIALNDTELTKELFAVTEEALTIKIVPTQFYLTVKTRVYPAKNKALNGLYYARHIYCTQCEPHGFRRMTYYIDRPDVMAIFTTTIQADAKKYPVLLSNGNLIDQGTLENNRHWVKWHDPFKKPCYLFALVAGDLACNVATYETVSKKEVVLRVYTEHENKDKCEYALTCLKNAMQWDEIAFGLEYDLDVYMIVAVNDFNMGAMENKGLNIFNSKYILANPSIATDNDYQDIEKVIGHEYFHNWSGNRVTLRDWFQLSLKEGLTVFRDQEFSAYHWSDAVKRIQSVQIIRGPQFSEDSSPLAHPVRPDSYIEMSNFYTLTVYHKGAEVIRMLYSLFGASGFRHGMDLYFSRFDGHAVTTDDFVQALSDANQCDLTQFKRWYIQAGTPTLEVDWQYDSDRQIWTLNVQQTCPATPGQSEKLPFHMPFAMALLDEKGKEIPLYLMEGDRAQNQDAFVLNITQASQQFHFSNVHAKPVPSLLRGFTAPVHLKAPYRTEDLLFLLIHDNDPVARWDAGQQLLLNDAMRLIHSSEQEELKINPVIIKALSRILTENSEDPAFIPLLLQLPDQNILAEQQHLHHHPVDIDKIYRVYRTMILQLAEALKSQLLETYMDCHSHTAYSISPPFVARRSLKNICLRYLGRLNTPEIHHIIRDQYYRADNMTDRFAALQAVNSVECRLRDELLADFILAWKHEPLVLDKWFALQAASELPSTTAKVRELLGHPEFLLENPNKLYALLGTFSHQNPYNFHDISGEGYRLFTDEILRIDRFNPQVAAHLAKVFAHWQRYDDKRQALLRHEMERIMATKGLSKDLNEIVSKCLV